MSLAYAPGGLLGVLTPQANTTVEPEFAILMPKGMAIVNARLTSPMGTIEERLVDYFAGMPTAIRQFANAPIGAIAIACTGASYLAGIEAETAMVAAAQTAAGVPVITSAIAVVDALRALGARRIGLVSPYPEALDRASTAYWTARGFTVAAVAKAHAETEAFHPIYSMPSGAALAGLDRLPKAVVMLGTGMPTLEPILARPFHGAAPVLSCMLATAWRATGALEKRAPTREGLLAFVHGTVWGGRERL